MNLDKFVKVGKVVELILKFIIDKNKWEIIIQMMSIHYITFASSNYSIDFSEKLAYEKLDSIYLSKLSSIILIGFYNFIFYG